MTAELQTTKELAGALKRAPGFVYAMRKAGFEMPGGMATLEEARDWLRLHPRFTTWGAWGRRDNPRQSAKKRDNPR